MIAGDEVDAQGKARAILDDATATAERVLADAHAAASEIVEEARREAARIAARDLHASISREPRAETARDHETDDSIDATDLRAAREDFASGRPAGRQTAESDVGDDELAGRVDEVIGLAMRATVPGVALGELVHIDRRERTPLAAEVVGFRGEQAVLLPLGELAGVAPAAAVWRTGAPLSIRCGEDLFGRVLDGIGAPIDGGPALAGEPWEVDRPAPDALSRPPLAEPQPTGVRAIDSLLTLGRGQRIGLFAAAGVGKSTLLGQIARGAEADAIVVCLVGERGRELGELLGGALAEARDRTVCVCATSDAPPLTRVRAIHTATAIAEWFREQRGARVLLLCDSLTRVARAQREVGLSVGEPPARHGYPPSVFALLPRVIERTGATPRGAITAIYTVLVAGNDLDEPIADEVRGLVDGHVVLDRRLAQRGHFPPIDIVASVSRAAIAVTGSDQAQATARVRARLAVYEEHRDLIVLGAYQAGRDPVVDDAVTAYPAIERHLRQAAAEHVPWEDALASLLTLAV